MSVNGLGLRINVEELLPEVGRKETVEGSVRVRFERSALSLGAEGTEVSWRLELDRIKGGLEVTGGIEGEVELQCDRCLAEYCKRLTLKVSEHILWFFTGEEDRAEDEYFVDEGILDLEPILRDSIVLAVPRSRLCHPECRGICPGCGADMNRDPCTCAEKPMDPRLSSLRDLKKRLSAERDEDA